MNLKKNSKSNIFLQINWCHHASPYLKQHMALGFHLFFSQDFKTTLERVFRKGKTQFACKQVRTMRTSYQVTVDYGNYVILVSSNIKCIMYNIIACNRKQPIGGSHVYAKFK